MTLSTASLAQTTDAQAIFDAEPATRAVAFWEDVDGSTYVQGQALVDNRPSRILARIERMGIDLAPDSLVIVTRG